ncbi:protein TIFY 10A [Rosa sericea]
MSSSSETTEMMMRMAEKPPSFSQTCSMLYQFLKEKGANLGDLNLDMQLPNNNGSGEMFRQKTQQMNFFPVMEKPRNVPAPRDFKSMDLFPQQAGFGPSLPKMTDSSVKKTVPGEPQKAQMTIFYGGQVIVFDDFPAEKAKEVMLLASKESSKSHQAAHPVKANTNSAFASHLGKVPINSGTGTGTGTGTAPVAPTSNPFPKFGNQVIQQQETIKPTPTRPIISDIPMQRKASLQRFLAKRKDRINNTAPYQMSSPGPSGPAKPEAESKSWLGLAAQPTQ